MNIFAGGGAWPCGERLEFHRIRKNTIRRDKVPERTDLAVAELAFLQVECEIDCRERVNSTNEVVNMIFVGARSDGDVVDKRVSEWKRLADTVRDPLEVRGKMF